jgi:uncharacterized protein (DUF983 family)
MLYKVVIRGELIADDSWSQHIENATGQDLQTGKCPDCGGIWVWWDAGYVSAHRKCTACGSMFDVMPGRNPAIRRARIKITYG